MVTPFDESGAVDYAAAADVARYLTLNGSDGLVVAGSTGEGSSLSDDEKLQLFACVAAAVTVPVLAGSTSADTAHSVELSARVASTGAAGILATVPAYARPSQKGIAAHFAAVAESTPLPIMLYDIPVRTGRKLASATTIEVVRRHPNVIALKDASADLPAAAATKAVLGESFDLYSGDDSLLLPFLAIGGTGVVSVASHWAGVEFSALVAAAHAGDWETARIINHRLSESCHFESSEMYPNPLPSKAALRALGLSVGQCRLPLGPSDAILDGQAREVVTALQATRG